TALVAQEQQSEGKEQPAVPASQSPAEPPSVFGLVLTITDKHNISNWVMDSGATSSATFDEADCVDVKDCDVQITAAGSSFSVKRIGTAIVHALDTTGKPQKITLSNCLISQLFPYKLLSLQAFTKKGHTVTMADDMVHISNKVNDVVLVGVRDPTSQLFMLRESPMPKADAQLLAKSYGGGDDLLWKLHLRHGHRNFIDICKQYNLPIPKVLPACTSCVMGKSHVHPPISSGFDRATRRAEGF